MSIIISNISESKGIKYLPNGAKGKQVYEVCLNNIPLVEFNHNTEDGMAECLIKAGEALKEVDIDSKIKDYEHEQYLKIRECIEGVLK
jgi:hypothetical protein